MNSLSNSRLKFLAPDKDDGKILKTLSLITTMFTTQ